MSQSTGILSSRSVFKIKTNFYSVKRAASKGTKSEGRNANHVLVCGHTCTLDTTLRQCSVSLTCNLDPWLLTGPIVGRRLKFCFLLLYAVLFSIRTHEKFEQHLQ